MMYCRWSQQLSFVIFLALAVVISHKCNCNSSVSTIVFSCDQLCPIHSTLNCCVVNVSNLCWPPCGASCCCGAIQTSERQNLNLQGRKKKRVLFSEAWEPVSPLKTLFQPFGIVPDGLLPNCACVVCFAAPRRCHYLWVVCIVGVRSESTSFNGGGEETV